MKKKILGLLLAICLIVGLLPVTALAEDPQPTNWIAINGKDNAVQLTEGCEPVYFKTVDMAVVPGGSEADYQIKLHYPVGGVPTIVLNGAKFFSEDQYGAINVGRDHSSSYDYLKNHAVDIIVTADTYIETGAAKCAPIVSYANGDLTIKTENGSKLELDSWLFWGSGIHATIRNNGNINLVNANISIHGNKDPEADMHIYSHTGNINIDGGNLSITTGGAWSGDGSSPVVHAPNGAINIQNGAKVAVLNQRGNATFVAANGININESSVKVAVTNEKGSIFGSKPTLTFANVNAIESVASATAPVASWDAAIGMSIDAPADAAAYDGEKYADYKFFSIGKPDFTWIAIGDSGFGVEITAGSAPVYFKTNSDGVVTKEGSEGDYQVKVYYPAGGRPTVVLNGAYIASGYAGINIGRDTSYGQYLDSSADIIVKADSAIYASSGAAPAIGAFIKGNLTIKSEDGAKLDIESYLYSGDGRHASIRANGNVKIENVALSIWGCKPSEADMFILSQEGGIVINGGSLKIMTGGVWSGDGAMHVVHAPKGAIAIRDGADVTIWNQRANGTFVAGKGITISESTVKVAITNENGFIFGSKPVLSYAEIDYLNSEVSANAPTAEGENVSSMVITAPESVGKYDEAAFNTYKYLSIAPHVHEFKPATCTDAKECEICGYTEGEELGHAYDNDCDTTCNNENCPDPEREITHTPEEDDGDCTTAVKCAICGEEAIAAKEAHTPAHADDDCATEDLCSVCGKVAIPAGECTPEEDDGDCTTAVKCAICGKEAVAAKEAHTPAEDDGDCTTAVKCTVCGKETTAAKEAHTVADDDDCTTAVKCSVCGKETVAAKEAHVYTDNADTTCDNEGCTHTRKVEDTSKPGTNGSPQTGDNSQITLWIALLVVSAIGIAAVVVFGKKRFAAK